MCASLVGVAVSFFCNPYKADLFTPLNYKIQREATLAGVRIVGIDEVRQLMTEGQSIIFDARHMEEYDKGHLPGALSFPYAEKEKAAAEWLGLLQPEQKVVVYCSGKMCDDSLQLSIFFKQMGMKQVFLFVEGMDGWKRSGGRVE